MKRFGITFPANVKLQFVPRGQICLYCNNIYQLTVHYIHKKFNIFTPVSSIRISLYSGFICSPPILNKCHLEFDVCRKLDCKSL